MGKGTCSDKKNSEAEDIRKRLAQWTRQYIALEKGEDVILARGIEDIKQNPIRIARLLYSAKNSLDVLIGEIEELHRNLNGLREDKRTLWEKIFGKGGQVEKLEERINTLKLNIEDVERERDELKRENSDLVWVREQIALMEKSEEARDKHATYNMKDSRPKDFNIAPEFSKVGRQIYGICNKLFRYWQGHLLDNRAQGIAQIYSELSRVIIWDFWHSSAKENAIGDAESPEAITAMVNVILGNLQINKESIELIAVRNQVEDLVKKGRRVIANIVCTEAPGELFLETKGTPFDKDKHEAMPSCGEDGEVQSTVYPGYRVADVVLSKPIVFTAIASTEKDRQVDPEA
jgi:chromosome segregation ATPase